LTKKKPRLVVTVLLRRTLRIARASMTTAEYIKLKVQPALKVPNWSQDVGKVGKSIES
jgi:hypothetical protein